MAVKFAYIPATHEGLTVVSKKTCWWCGASDETDHSEAEHARCMQKQTEYYQSYEEHLDELVHGK